MLENKKTMQTKKNFVYTVFCFREKYFAIKQLFVYKLAFLRFWIINTESLNGNGFHYLWL